MGELLVEAVVHLTACGVQPTARQVAKLFQVPDGAMKPLLRVATEQGALTVAQEWIEQAKGEFAVYRSACCEGRK